MGRIERRQLVLACPATERDPCTPRAGARRKDRASGQAQAQRERAGQERGAHNAQQLPRARADSIWSTPQRELYIMALIRGSRNAFCPRRSCPFSLRRGLLSPPEVPLWRTFPRPVFLRAPLPAEGVSPARLFLAHPTRARLLYGRGPVRSRSTPRAVGLLPPGPRRPPSTRPVRWRGCIPSRAAPSSLGPPSGVPSPLMQLSHSAVALRRPPSSRSPSSHLDPCLSARGWRIRPSETSCQAATRLWGRSRSFLVVPPFRVCCGVGPCIDRARSKDCATQLERRECGGVGPSKNAPRQPLTFHARVRA